MDNHRSHTQQGENYTEYGSLGGPTADLSLVAWPSQMPNHSLFLKVPKSLILLNLKFEVSSVGGCHQEGIITS